MLFDPIRNKRWVDVSNIYGSKEIPYFFVDIQQLGQTERILLELERQSVELHLRQQEPDFDFNEEKSLFLPIQLSGLTKYWVFGLYEVLRNFRDYKTETLRPKTFPAPYDRLEALFHDLEILRMPLAKYEAAKINDSLHWPKMFFHSETGCIAWEVFCKKRNTMIVLDRLDLTERFLATSEEIKKELDKGTKP